MGLTTLFSSSNQSGITIVNTGTSAANTTGTNALRHQSVIPKFNAGIRKWGNTTNAILRNVVKSRLTKGKIVSPHIYASGIHKGKEERKLGESLKASFKNEEGGAKIEVIRFGLERHGVFVQKGVGRGYPISGKNTQNPALPNKSVGGRRPKDWYNSTIDKNTRKLSDTLVRHSSDAIVLNARHSFIK